MVEQWTSSNKLITLGCVCFILVLMREGGCKQITPAIASTYTEAHQVFSIFKPEFINGF